MTTTQEPAGEPAPGQAAGEARVRAAGQIRLLRDNADLRRLVTAVFMLEIGQSTTWVGIPLLVIKRYGLGLDVGLTTGLIAFPNIFLGVAAGNLVDRNNPRNVAIMGAVLSGLLVTLFPVTTALWQIQLLAVLVGTGYMFIVPAAMALRPRVMDAGSELSGNGMVVSAQHLSRLVGPTIAGPVIAFAGLAWIFGFEAVMAIVAALFLARLTVRAANPHQPPLAARPASWGRALISGVASIAGLVRGSSRLTALTLTVFTYMIAFGLGSILLATYSLRAFSHVPGMLGYLLGALGVGGAAGAILAPLLARRNRGLFYVLASVLEGISWAFVPSVGVAAVALVLLFIAGALESAATVVFYAEVQPRLPAEYTGRYYAMVLSGGDACQLTGRSIGGFMTAKVGMHWTAMTTCIVFAGPALALAAPLVRDKVRPAVPAPGGGNAYQVKASHPAKDSPLVKAKERYESQ
jgi:MFS family permease